jgi:hypothetical protein
MNPEMMAKVNWWLEHPPPVDVAVSRNIGLFVVGRLAARHGIKVRLQPAASGGLTALVWLPDPIIVLPEAAAPASFASPEPEAQARHTKAVGGPRVAWRLRALAPSQANSRSEPSPQQSQPSPAEDPAGGRRLPIYEAVESDWFSTRRTLSQHGASRGRAAYGHDGPDPAR